MSISSTTLTHSWRRESSARRRRSPTSTSVSTAGSGQVVTYQEAEAILHECLQMQEHLHAQDRALEGIVRRMQQLETKLEQASQ